MGLLITLYDTRRSFCEVLAAYMNEQYKEQLTVMAFDDVNRLKDFLGQTKAELCILSVAAGELEAELGELLLDQKLQTLFLTGERTQDGIYRYQPVDELARQIFRLCIERKLLSPIAASGLHPQNPCRIIGFYSTPATVCQTLMALAVSQRLAEQGSRALYLNFQPFSALGCILQKEFQQDLLDLLFFLHEEKEGFGLRLKGIAETAEGFAYIPPAFSAADLEEIEASDWEKLIIRIATESGYDALILDFSDKQRGLIRLLDLCGEICFCVAPDGFGAEKKKQLLRFLSYVKKEELTERIKYYPAFAASGMYGTMPEYWYTQLKKTAGELIGK